jgi:hypothetical protein
MITYWLILDDLNLYFELFEDVLRSRAITQSPDICLLLFVVIVAVGLKKEKRSC